ncbi:MAG: hypothetical protein ACI9OJ_005651 [Myxococcota bacterium]
MGYPLLVFFMDDLSSPGEARSRLVGHSPAFTQCSAAETACGAPDLIVAERSLPATPDQARTDIDCEFLRVKSFLLARLMNATGSRVSHQRVDAGSWGSNTSVTVTETSIERYPDGRVVSVTVRRKNSPSRRISRTTSSPGSRSRIAATSPAAPSTAASSIEMTMS